VVNRAFCFSEERSPPSPLTPRSSSPHPRPCVGSTVGGTPGWGLNGPRFKLLRRTHASLGHDAGIDPKVAADQRGQNIGVAIDVYTKAAPSRRAEAAEQLEKDVLTA
jgi:hypothetical protein